MRRSYPLHLETHAVAGSLPLALADGCAPMKQKSGPPLGEGASGNENKYKSGARPSAVLFQLAGPLLSILSVGWLPC